MYFDRIEKYDCEILEIFVDLFPVQLSVLKVILIRISMQIVLQ